ncbi:MAG: IPT/TIG domain-containing protein [bacterium]|nr:IPT/TIG domain-containing protein [bacterium]
MLTKTVLVAGAAAGILMLAAPLAFAQSGSPTITSLSPASGPIRTSITINGTAFTPTGNVIYIDGYNLTANYLYIIASSSGSGSFVSSNANGTSITFTLPSVSTPLCGLQGLSGSTVCPNSKLITTGTHTLIVKNANGVSLSAAFVVTATNISAETAADRTARLAANTADIAAAKTAQAAATVTNTTAIAGKITCVGIAINTREVALDSAMTTYGTAVNAAYAARKTALQTAYTLTAVKEVGAAVKTAWSTFNTSMRNAKRAWQTARNAAWTAYRGPAVACNAPAGTGDGINSGFEASGG